MTGHVNRMRAKFMKKMNSFKRDRIKTLTKLIASMVLMLTFLICFALGIKSGKLLELFPSKSAKEKQTDVTSTTTGEKYTNSAGEEVQTAKDPYTKGPGLDKRAVFEFGEVIHFTMVPSIEHKGEADVQVLSVSVHDFDYLDELENYPITRRDSIPQEVAWYRKENSKEIESSGYQFKLISVKVKYTNTTDHMISWCLANCRIYFVDDKTYIQGCGTPFSLQTKESTNIDERCIMYIEAGESEELLLIYYIRHGIVEDSVEKQATLYFEPIGLFTKFRCNIDKYIGMIGFTNLNIDLQKLLDNW